MIICSSPIEVKFYIQLISDYTCFLSHLLNETNKIVYFIFHMVTSIKLQYSSFTYSFTRTTIILTFLQIFKSILKSKTHFKKPPILEQNLK